MKRSGLLSGHSQQIDAHQIVRKHTAAAGLVALGFYGVEHSDTDLRQFRRILRDFLRAEGRFKNRLAKLFNDVGH